MKDTIPSARRIVQPVEASALPESVLILTAAGRNPAVLETVRPSAICGRFSVFACDPVETFTVSDVSDDQADSPIRRFAQRVAGFPALDAPPDYVPFAGGWIGYFAYEAGLIGQRVPPRSAAASTIPLVRFGLYDHVLVFDHTDERWYACAIDWPEAWRLERLPVARRLDILRKRLYAAETARPAPLPEPTTTVPVANMSREAYRMKAARAMDYIRAGDIYQVNLTRRFSARTDASPLELYRRLRRFDPAPHAAFLQWDEGAIVSASPELFLDVCDRRVVTRPIKGTRPRVGDEIIDASRRRELDESEKERAELTMIVDLLRNDLGRVCEYGSIRVTDPGAIEEHPTVFHRVATITGRLSPDRGWADLLEAALPGGSVTGAPKIRAMQIIRELEPTPRGVYCGSIGWIGLDGNLSLNIAIRTMVQRESTVHVHAGGAIVAESDPQQEYEEIQAKAAGMFAALNVRQVPRRVRSRRRKEVSVA
jgi:para-aminobenzoate synthetase component 1